MTTSSKSTPILKKKKAMAPQPPTIMTTTTTTTTTGIPAPQKEDSIDPSLDIERPPSEAGRGGQRGAARGAYYDDVSFFCFVLFCFVVVKLCLVLLHYVLLCFSFVSFCLLFWLLFCYFGLTTKHTSLMKSSDFLQLRDNGHTRIGMAGTVLTGSY